MRCYEQLASFLAVFFSSLSIPLTVSQLYEPQLATSLPYRHEEASQLKPFKASSDIPSVQKAFEMAHLSRLVYSIHDCSSFPQTVLRYSSENASFNLNNSTYKCQLYERDSQDTRVLIVSRTTENSDINLDYIEDYIAVIYAGTHDFRNALTDSNIKIKKFGNKKYNIYNDTDDILAISSSEDFISLHDDVRVHAGFNNAVFNNNLMDRVLQVVLSVRDEGQQEGRKYRIFTTGHSLGAADSVLSSVILASYFDYITSINFGCPKLGNKGWKKYVNSIPNLGIFRIVNRMDLGRFCLFFSNF